MSLFKKSNLLLIYFLFVFAYWLVLYISNTKYSQANYIYQFVFGLIPLIGGIGGLINAKKWGGLRSGLGKALTFLSLGIISWGLGQMVWSYYTIFENTKIPFPSFADLGYLIALPLWAIGIINLSKATGAKFGLRNKGKKVAAIALSVITAASSYYLLVVVARDGTLIPEGDSLIKILLDVGYPLGDLVILTLALLISGLSAGYLGGKYKSAIYTLLGGFVVMYIADFSFAYTINTETYFNGHWVDLLFPTAMVMMAYGLNKLEPIAGPKPKFPTAKSDTVPPIAVDQQVKGDYDG